jgi:hypothetical protein
VGLRVPADVAGAAVAEPNCSRESLIAFTNGQSGPANPHRQGLNAAVLGGPPPLKHARPGEVPGALYRGSAPGRNGPHRTGTK